MHLLCSVSSSLGQGISSPKSSDRTTSGCQWWTWIWWDFLNQPKHLGKGRRCLEMGTQARNLSDEGTFFISLMKNGSNVFRTMSIWNPFANLEVSHDFFFLSWKQGFFHSSRITYPTWISEFESKYSFNNSKRQTALSSFSQICFSPLLH